MFVPLSFFFWPFCCLSIDLRILITSMVSSNSSWIVTGNNWPLQIVIFHTWSMALIYVASVVWVWCIWIRFAQPGNSLYGGGVVSFADKK
jgi:hypothetical protein